MKIHQRNFKTFRLRYTGCRRADFHFDDVDAAMEFPEFEDLTTMASMAIEVPDGALAAMWQDSVGFASEMRLPAAVKWYELRRASQQRLPGFHARNLSSHWGDLAYRLSGDDRGNPEGSSRFLKPGL